MAGVTSKAGNTSHLGAFQTGAGLQRSDAVSPEVIPNKEHTEVRPSSVSPLQKGSTNIHHDEANSRPSIPKSNAFGGAGSGIK